MKKFLICVSLMLICANAHATSIYTVGSTTLKTYTNADEWFYYGLVIKGKTYMDVSSSGNGSVIRYSPNQMFAGPIHGNFVKQSNSLLRNGVPTNISDNQNLVGNCFTLSKTDLYNSSYRVTSTLTLVEGGFDQHISFQGIDSTKIADLFYASLGTRSDRLTNWIAYDANGKTLGTGLTIVENSGNTYMPAGTMMVAQYDPILLDGLITRWVFSGSSQSFIVDRPYDNKLYMNVPSMYGPANKNLELTESVRVFYGPENALKAIPEPYSITLMVIGIIAMFLFYRRK